MKNLIVLFLLLMLGSMSSGQQVYKTPSGKKYHLASCRMVRNVSQAMTVKEASELGLGACHICNPPVANNAPLSTGNKAQGEDKTTQCKGLTKAGARCKHMTKIANGYCYQHQP